MKLKEFFAVTRGSRQLCFSETEKPLCGRDFWAKYSGTPVWDAEVEWVRMVARRAEQDGLWFDGVICYIKLKEDLK